MIQEGTFCFGARDTRNHFALIRGEMTTTKAATDVITKRIEDHKVAFIVAEDTSRAFAGNITMITQTMCVVTLIHSTNTGLRITDLRNR